MTTVSDPLRPQRLTDFGGQRDLTRDLDVLISAARSRDQMPDHVLLVGGPGLGKTTLAQIIANEAGVPLITAAAPGIEKPGDLAALLTGLRTPSVVFIDEIHALDRRAEELLYSAMEDHVIDVIVGEGVKARTVKINVTPFTLIGATTQAGLLSNPLRDRFGYTGRVALYDDDALAAIVRRSAQLLDVELDAEGAAAIASRSRGTPRVANRWLRRVRDWADVHHSGVITADIAAEALDAYGVDRLGLDPLAREILTTLIAQFGGGPVGVGTLAAAVGESVSTLEEIYEPYLMRKGLITRTPRGRVATGLARTHLGLDDPDTQHRLL